MQGSVSQVWGQSHMLYRLRCWCAPVLRVFEVRACSPIYTCTPTPPAGKRGSWQAYSRYEYLIIPRETLQLHLCLDSEGLRRAIRRQSQVPMRTESRRPRIREPHMQCKHTICLLPLLRQNFGRPLKPLKDMSQLFPFPLSGTFPSLEMLKRESKAGSQSGKDHGDKCTNRTVNFQVTFLGGFC